MIFNKVWAMPNSKTFTIKPIKEFVGKHIAGAKVIIDPFANSCKYGTITNDLNPEIVSHGGSKNDTLCTMEIKNS